MHYLCLQKRLFHTHPASLTTICPVINLTDTVCHILPYRISAHVYVGVSVLVHLSTLPVHVPLSAMILMGLYFNCDIEIHVHWFDVILYKAAYMKFIFSKGTQLKKQWEGHLLYMCVYV